jgi:2,3-bisphosphoglycerate-independent phosphoglycerate mutase
MHASLLPPPTANLKNDCELRVRRLVDLMKEYDCLYIHLKGPDEPGHDGNCHRKTDIISAIDDYFFGNLLEKIKLEECIICVTSDHATPCALKVHSDTPVPLLISGGTSKDENVKFSERDCMKGSLGTLERGFELMPRLMQLLKRQG